MARKTDPRIAWIGAYHASEDVVIWRPIIRNNWLDAHKAKLLAQFGKDEPPVATEDDVVLWDQHDKLVSSLPRSDKRDWIIV